LRALRYRPRLSNKAPAEAKPRILLVDDHRQVLESVSQFLATDFDVVAVATDGRAAIDVSRQVQPDAIVMDIAMPRLDGFQAVRELRRTGSAAKVVFLSMYDSDDYVGEAFECGGQGFVLKTRMGADLVSALDQTLAGRLFVPSLKSLFQVADGGAGHAIQLHRHGDAYLDAAAEFFDLALQRGDATCLIGTEPVREGLSERLRQRGWDIDPASDSGRYRAVDAGDALDRFMRDDLPDPDRLAEIAAELDHYRLEAAEGPAPRLTIMGQMAALLSLRGNSRAVVELERAWSRLTHALPFLTLCSYSAACFDDEMHANLFADTCAEHWAVSHAPHGA
jgi:CheY-like chemotaxis protein